MRTQPAPSCGHAPSLGLLAALLPAIWSADGAAASADAIGFHGAPPETAGLSNPAAGDRQAPVAGAGLYRQQCAGCHGDSGEGSGEIPALAHGPVQSAPPGEVFWFVTHGSEDGRMPSFAALSETQRWQIIDYVQGLGASEPLSDASAAGGGTVASAPAPTAPFTDFRFEAPGTIHHITVADLPPPYATESARNAPAQVSRPADAWPVAPTGFRVNLYATDLGEPRVIRTAPNGDVFLAESGNGQLRVFRGLTADGKPEISSVFATGLNRPYGIAFYPPGRHPRWIYIGDADAVMRIRYRPGELQAHAPAERVLELPPERGHWTRDLQFSADGKRMFIAVGSASNVDDPDTHPIEHLRANILVADPDGAHERVFASGIRNPSGLAIDPVTGDLWCTVNERDALGDNLVPDYITRVREGGFYGWPWWYIGAHQDPRHEGSHPELRAATIVPDILLQPHNASLQIAFYQGEQFPSEYRGDLFAAEHGSWNKSVRTGYELIRIPLHQADRPSGDYQDFLTGFVLPNGEVWGRPVGVTVAADGALLVTDDASNSIWRVSYVGQSPGAKPR